MAKKQLQPEETNTDKTEEVLPLPESDVFADIIPSSVPGQTFFGFRVANLGFMVSVNMYCEVLDKFQINRLPNVQPWFHGLINLRGNLVPAFDLRRVLGEVVGDNKKRRLFVIGRGDKAVALWIDNFPEILDFTLMQPLQQPPELPPFLQRTVSRVFTHNGQIWLDCQLDSLFTALGRHHYNSEETGS
jgi:twitching motility protein PilI